MGCECCFFDTRIFTYVSLHVTPCQVWVCRRSFFLEQRPRLFFHMTTLSIKHPLQSITLSIPISIHVSFHQRRMNKPSSFPQFTNTQFVNKKPVADDIRMCLRFLCAQTHTFISVLETELKHATCGCAHVSMYLLAFCCWLLLFCSSFWVPRPMHHMSTACKSCKLRAGTCGGGTKGMKKRDTCQALLTVSLKGLYLSHFVSRKWRKQKKSKSLILCVCGWRRTRLALVF